MSGKPAPQQNIPGEINTPHGQEFMKKEIWDEIDMLYPIRSAGEISDIANKFGVDDEDVLNILQSYELKKGKEKEEELNSDVEYFLHNNFDLSVDKRLPTFEEFFKKFNKAYSEEEYKPSDVKIAFDKLTKDPNQLSLFEFRKRVNKMLKEVFEEKEMRYVVSLQCYVYGKDDASAIQEAQNLAKDLSQKEDNSCEVVQVTKQPFGKIGGVTIYKK